MQSKAVLFLIALVGCGTPTYFSRTNSAPRPLASKAPDAVTVFAGNRPVEPFVVLGILKAINYYDMFDRTHALVAAMKREAGARGCDGLIIEPNRNGNYSIAALTGECIVFAEPSLAARPGW